MNRSDKIKALKALASGDRSALIGLIPERPLFIDYVIKDGVYYLDNGISGTNLEELRQRLMDSIQPQFLGEESNDFVNLINR